MLLLQVTMLLDLGALHFTIIIPILGCTVLYSAIEFRIVLYSESLHYSAVLQCSIVLYSTSLHYSAVLQCSIAVLQCSIAVQYCIIQCSIACTWVVQTCAEGLKAMMTVEEGSVRCSTLYYSLLYSA